MDEQTMKVEEYPQAPSPIPFEEHQQPQTDGEPDDMSDDDIEGGS